MPDWESELNRCRKWLEPVFDRYETYRWEDVILNVKEGKWWLLPLKKSALLIEFIKYPRRNTLYVLAAGGDIEEITRSDRTVEKIARETNCTSIEIRGRKGWEKIAKQMYPDYKTKYVVISKEL
tara:strand:+ start:130 stop:501 length:372 start_codon:yes stop_codon:yes gene_type:complete